jgi:phospholipid/cholesterol/gamma-HCH transport system substrate-binding protein
MPRTRSLAWSELKIGIVMIVAVAIAAALIFTLTGGRGLVWQRYGLKTRFTNVAGLAPGSPVRIAGKEVGTVKDVELAGELVDITFEVNKQYRDIITSASMARLGSVSLLGQAAIDITPSSRGTAIPEWGYVPAGKMPAQIADLSDSASQSIEEITGLVRDLRGGRGLVGKLVTDEQLYVDLQKFVAAAGDVTRGLQQGKGSVGRLLKDPKMAQSLEASVKNLQDITAQINAGQGSLGKLLKDPAFSDALTGATSNMRTITESLKNGEGTAGKLMTDASLFNRLNSVTDRLDQLTKNLNAGEGTAGQLLKDTQLYENMNKTVAEFSALLTEIKKDPKKYLSVKVSIW